MAIFANLRTLEQKNPYFSILIPQETKIAILEKRLGELSFNIMFTDVASKEF